MFADLEVGAIKEKDLPGIIFLLYRFIYSLIYCPGFFIYLCDV